MYRLSIVTVVSSIICNCCPVPTFIVKRPPSYPTAKIGLAYRCFHGCSQPLEEDFPPVKIYIPEGSYRGSFNFGFIWRYPYFKPIHYTDIYHMSPIPDVAINNKLFIFSWKATFKDNDFEAASVMICPKVSWTEKDPIRRECDKMKCTDERFFSICRNYSWKENYYKKASCYSIAGLDSSGLVSCWEDKEGKEWSYLPDNTDGRGPERMGCKSLSPKDFAPGTVVEFEFLTDRLGNFRLLPPSDEERTRVRDWRKPGSLFQSPEGICEVVPDSSRWAFRFGEDGTVFGRLICRDDGDCREGQRCEKYEKSCRPDLGLCREVPAAGPEK